MAPIETEKWEQAKALKLGGRSWASIANELQLPIGTLKSRWHRENLPQLEKGMRTVQASTPQRIVQNAEATIEEISKRVRDLLAADSLATSLRVAQYDPSDIREEGMREQVMGSLVKRSAQVLGWESATSTVQVQVGVIASLPDRPSDHAE